MCIYIRNYYAVEKLFYNEKNGKLYRGEEEGIIYLIPVFINE